MRSRDNQPGSERHSTGHSHADAKAFHDAFEKYLEEYAGPNNGGKPTWREAAAKFGLSTAGLRKRFQRWDGAWDPTWGWPGGGWYPDWYVVEQQQHATAG
jgi:hypothetical protein